jgi:hypothetical protein
VAAYEGKGFPSKEILHDQGRILFFSIHGIIHVAHVFSGDAATQLL